MTCPPGESRRSKMRWGTPAFARWKAADMPVSPAPRTATGVVEARRVILETRAPLLAQGEAPGQVRRGPWYTPGVSRPPASRSGAALAVRAKPPRRPDVDVDVVVVGGGVNGLGVARDATKRGLKVVLFERNDLAFGASGNSSGMIHGGPRYLTYDPHVTETSCRDSGHIQAIAPHLLFRIPFLIPVENTAKGRFLYPLMDAFFAAYDEYQPLKRGKPHARLTPGELRALEPGLAGDLTGGFSMDEWGIDGARLCVANAVDAMERGARIFVGVTVERIEALGGGVHGYTVHH